MRTLTFFLLLILLFGVRIAASADQADVGEYSLSIKSRGLSPTRMEQIIDIDLSVTIPKGDGFSYIPLPIRKTNNMRMIIEPTSSNNFVLFGYIRPNEDFGLCAIKRSNQNSSHLRIVFKNVLIPIHQSGRSDSDIVVNILLNEAYKQYLQYNNIIKQIPLLINAYLLKFDYFKDSYPISTPSDTQDRRSVSIKDPRDPENIVIYLSKKEGESFLYWVLITMGILLGYFAAPKFITSGKRAKYSLIIEIIILISLVIIFFGYLPKQQRIADTTTIVTFGSVFGVLIGLIINSIYDLSKNDSVSDKYSSM